MTRIGKSRKEQNSIKMSCNKKTTKLKTKKINLATVKIKKQNLNYLRILNQNRLKSTWAKIIKRYQKLSEDDADVIDIKSQEVVVNRGNIQKDDAHRVGYVDYSSTSSEDGDESIWWTDPCVEDINEFCAEEIIESDVEEIIESGTEEIIESNAEEIIEFGADDVIESGAEDVIESGAEDVIESGTEETIESGAEDNLIEFGAEETIESGAEDNIIEFGAEDNIIESGAEENYKSQGKEKSNRQEYIQKQINYYEVESGSEGFQTCSDWETETDEEIDYNRKDRKAIHFQV
ncbi:11496_t:CDS:2 [Diversispora eburnea]|uniref:11496_t:CDS:1 n=1 Tax=Diversispora eburnea TaxID=1213867 RepID=A0A9N8UZV1_9GLOM|nr:11496_t:CDS:2 [Diversispora eburnea]